MDHTLSIAVIAGLLGLTLLGALLLRQGLRVRTSVETMRAALATSGLSARTAGHTVARHGIRLAEAEEDKARSGEQEDPDASVRSDAPERGDPLVTIAALDSEGHPRPRWIPLSILLRGVGIGTHSSEPGVAVIAQAQCELRALAQLARNLGTSDGEDIDFADLGLALEGISHRLEVASEIFDAIQEIRLRKARRTTTEEPPAAAEPPPSDDTTAGSQEA